MKIVTYNVNSLKQRVTQFGSLLNLLNSLQADIICIQETKLARQELTADLVTAEGYESFFSCTRTTERARVGYSGVATFCRVKSAFTSKEVALPLAAEEGITGLLPLFGKVDAVTRDHLHEIDIDLDGIGKVTKEDLVKVDNEGRCIITDHGHFVLFNLYGPRAEPDDEERIRFKLIFFKILQRRWESLLSQGKRVFVVGDLNIAPTAMDRSDAGPDFEKNQFRKWLRSLLVEQGGPFFDAFRAKHPQRREAYTCWAANTGAEEFNHGSRIDHILIGGTCMHLHGDKEGHNLLDCHVQECDILTQFKRCKTDSIPRWKGGRSIRLEGSDHVPVYLWLQEIPDLPVHNVPPLAARYVPEVRGRQQTIVSLLQKRQEDFGAKDPGGSHSVPGESVAVEACSLNVEGSCQGCDPITKVITGAIASQSSTSQNLTISNKRRSRHANCSQRTLTSFFLKKVPSTCLTVDLSVNQVDVLKANFDSSLLTEETNSANEASCLKNDDEVIRFCPDQSPLKACCDGKEKSDVASLEWQRIQRLMQKSLPLCKGHGEPCVARSVKKAGPNMGRGFYVCARSEGPASNPEARCDHFEWGSSKLGRKRK